MRIKSVAMSALFLIGLTLILCTINECLVPKYYLTNNDYPSTSTFTQFYSMDRNSIDVIFLGSSYCVNGFSPLEIYKNYNIRSYNLGSEFQSVFLSYYWLKEALRFQNPSVVVLEARFLQRFPGRDVINSSESSTRKCLDRMRWSNVKFEAISQLCSLDQTHSFASWFLTNIRYHERWKSLEETDFLSKPDLRHSQLMGWAPGNTKVPSPFTPLIASDEDRTFKLDPLMVEYCTKMADLCNKNGIQMVLVGVPVQKDPGVHYAIQRLSEENNIDYVEMSEIRTWTELDAKMPEENPIDHGNIWGNIRISQYIGKLLKEKYGVNAVHDQQYEEQIEYYEHIKNSYRLKDITDIDEYLSLLKDERFSVFIAVSDEAVSGMRNSTRKGLAELGFEHVWDKETDDGHSYIGLKTDGGIHEENGGRITLSGRFRKKRESFSIVSSGKNDEGGSFASIRINDVEYSRKETGLNIVVYDFSRQCVVDSVNFNTHDDSEARR